MMVPKLASQETKVFVLAMNNWYGDTWLISEGSYIDSFGLALASNFVCNTYTSLQIQYLNLLDNGIAADI